MSTRQNHKLDTALIAVVCWVFAFPVLAQEWSLSTLLAALHQVHDSTSRFVETKTIRLLNQAQRSSGRLIYVAPDHLRKETIEPSPASLTIDGDRLTIDQQGEPSKQISLHDNVEVAALVDSVRATLAGDLATLTHHFNAALRGGVDDWNLTLEPKDPRLRELVTSIRIGGARTSIHEIETLEADGDRTDMIIATEPK